MSSVCLAARRLLRASICCWLFAFACLRRGTQTLRNYAADFASASGLAASRNCVYLLESATSASALVTRFREPREATKSCLLACFRDFSFMHVGFGQI